MRCQAEGCRKTKNVSTSTKLCPSCESSFYEAIMNDRKENSLNQDTSLSMDPAENVSGPFKLDIMSLQSSYNSMLMDPVNHPKIFVDIYGMLLSILSKQKEVDQALEQIKRNTARIDELEAKVGKSSEVAEKVSICIKHLPPPSPGVTELEHVKTTLSQIILKRSLQTTVIYT